MLLPPDTCGRLPVPEVYCGFGESFDMSDGMPHLIDLRFAHDSLLFAQSALEVGGLLDSLVAELSEVGVCAEC